MTISRREKYLLQAELIGRAVEIIESSNRTLVGVKGVIRDETKNMLIIETKDGIKKVIKDQCVFAFKTQKGIIKLNGKKLVHRPEDRILKKIK